MTCEGEHSYYAKPIDGYKGSYEAHISKCMETAYSELNVIRESLCGLVKTYGEDPGSFIREALLAIVFHDVGKLNPLFQEQMKKKIKNIPIRKSEYFRHELLSALFLILFDKNNITSKAIPFHFLAVLGHHKKINSVLAAFEREAVQFKEWPVLDENALMHAIQIAEKLYPGCNSGQVKLPPKNQMQFIIKFFEQCTEKTSLDKFGTEKARLLYSLMKGFLHFCDWVASGKNADYHRLCCLDDVTKDSIISSLKKKVEKDGREYRESRFHKECCIIEGNNVAIAPTGSGKTEAALLWAINNKRKKLIFLLPTRTTSNSLYERFVKYYFNEQACGLVHSSADTYFSGTYESSDFDDIQANMLLHRAFIPAVTVATVDQMLTTGFNTGLWTQREYAMFGSSIVIDEIQAYDTFTLALITETMKKALKLRARIMVMSATMPSFLREHLCKTLKVDTPIYATEFMGVRRNKWVYIDKYITEIRKYVLKEIKKCKKVALIVNDIETAKKEYLYYEKHVKTLCLHSEFTMKDRQDKERELTHGNPYELTIATQVIEVSLDVSFDTMFSECAPLECLIQRAGRCNRYGLLDDSNFIVFNASEISSKIYKNKDVMEITKKVIVDNQKRLDEREIFCLLEQVYEKIDLYRDKDYKEGETIYREIENKGALFDRDFEDDLNTRIGDIYRIQIIPSDFINIVEDLFERKEYSKIRLYEVPVSLKKLKKAGFSKPIENRYRLPIFAIKYDKKYGITSSMFY